MLAPDRRDGVVRPQLVENAVGHAPCLVCCPPSPFLTHWGRSLMGRNGQFDRAAAAAARKRPPVAVSEWMLPLLDPRMSVVSDPVFVSLNARRCPNGLRSERRTRKAGSIRCRRTEPKVWVGSRSIRNAYAVFRITRTVRSATMESRSALSRNSIGSKRSSFATYVQL